MKKIFILFTLVLLVGFCGFSQQVEREMVVLEIGTGTWCGYCPAAANGADELVENGCDVAVIEYHNGDEYANDFSNARISYYGMPGFPSSYFDGIDRVGGGGPASQSNYSRYLPVYNKRKAIKSSFSISIDEISKIGNETYIFTVTSKKVAESNASNLKLHAVITESHIKKNWLGLTELHFVERTMLPNHNGTNIVFGDDNTFTQKFEVTLGSDWNYEHCELVLFIQDGAKEIHQGKKMALADVVPGVDIDVAVLSLSAVPSIVCSNQMSPSVTIANLGKEVITSYSIHYGVNNTDNKYEWQGSLASGEVAKVELPKFSFEMDDKPMTFKVNVTDPNGTDDQYINNNSMQATMGLADDAAGVLELTIRTDSKPEELTWALVNEKGEVIHQGGPYDKPNTFVERDTKLPLSSDGCYAFIVRDSGGNGFSNGPGMIRLKDGNNVIFRVMNENFGDYREVQFNYGVVGIEELTESLQYTLFPNPASTHADLVLNVETNTELSLVVLDACGRKVYDNNSSLRAGENTINIPTNNMERGIYFVTAKIGNRVVTERLIVQ